MHLDDDGPEWDQHSGGSGHDDPAWEHGDEDRALLYWDALDERGRDILRYLIRHRARKVPHTELVRELGLDPGGTKRSANVVAGSLYRASEGNKAAGRRYPFTWWEGKGGASYAVEKGTARIFESALNAARVAKSPGETVAFISPEDGAWPLVQRLNAILDGSDVRMVLGSACTTALKAVQQFTAALQLPYAAAQGWTEFIEHLGDRPASLRQCIVIADACQMLKYEDHDVWRRLAEVLPSGPHHMGGGASTLVLVDDETAWGEWAFRTIADVRPQG